MTHLLRQLVCFIVLRPSGQVASSICLHMYRPILFWCQWSPHSCRRHKSIKCMPCQGSLNHKPTMNLQLIYVLPANSCSTKWTNDLKPLLEMACCGSRTHTGQVVGVVSKCPWPSRPRNHEQHPWHAEELGRPVPEAKKIN